MAEVSDFLKNERPNEYEARFSVSGELCVDITASSLEEAKQKAKAMMDNEEFGYDIEEVNDVRLNHVWKKPVMFLVTRDGRKMQVSRLDDGDLPRQPDQDGF